MDYRTLHSRAWGLQLATLAGPRRLVRGAALAAGAAVPLIAVAAVVLALGNAVSLHESPTAKAVIDVVLGSVLVLLGVRSVLRPPKPKPSKPQHASAAGPGRSFALGIAAMAVNVTTIALFIPAMKLIIASGLDDAELGVATAIVLLMPSRRCSCPWS